MNRYVKIDSKGVVGVPSGAPVGLLTSISLSLRNHWGFYLAVVLPTLLSCVYFFAIASDQYESETHFMVRSSQQTMSAPSGIGQLFGLGGMQSESESASIADYLNSHDAVETLNERINLVAMFRRPEADPLSRLPFAHPTSETLLKTYRRFVHVSLSDEGGEVYLNVRAFRPEDAKSIAENLLALGEARVNYMNARAQQDTLKVSAGEVANAESDLMKIQSQMTQFRTSKRDIDPEKSAGGELLLSSHLQEQLAQAQAQLDTMSRYVNSDSPQRQALLARVHGLQAQIGAVSGRMTGTGANLAPNLADYQALQLRQELAGKRYAAATSALALAREQALKQQLFVVRVVEPNLPQKSLYPRRFVFVLTTFIAALLAYGIGWLILAGIKEHGA